MVLINHVYNHSHSLFFTQKFPKLKIRRNYNKLYNKIGRDSEQSKLTMTLQTVGGREHSNCKDDWNRVSSRRILRVQNKTSGDVLYNIYYYSLFISDPTVLSARVRSHQVELEVIKYYTVIFNQVQGCSVLCSLAVMTWQNG